MSHNQHIKICIPFYSNQEGSNERYLIETIHGVLTQKYTNWSITVVDDASPIRSARAIVESFKDQRRPISKRKKSRPSW